jgi:hypothetical protein
MERVVTGVVEGGIAAVLQAALWVVMGFCMLRLLVGWIARH